MNLKTIGLAATLFFSSVLPGQAATCGTDLGDVTSGAACSDVLVKQTFDWMDFSIATDPGFGMTELSITAQTVAGSNFNPVLGLYFGDTLIAATGNYAGTQGVPLTLSLSGRPALGDGTYRLGIAGRNAFFAPNIADARTSAFFRNGSYQLDIATTVSAIPLPAGAVLLLTALGGLGLARRNRRVA